MTTNIAAAGQGAVALLFHAGAPSRALPEQQR